MSGANFSNLVVLPWAAPGYLPESRIVSTSDGLVPVLHGQVSYLFLTHCNREV